MADKPVYTSEQYVAQLTRLGVWASPTQPIAYAFLEAGPTYLEFEPSFAPFTPAHREGAREAFALVAQVCNLSFVEVPDNGAEPGATNQRITFRTINTPQQFSGSASPYFSNGTDRIQGADIVLNLKGMQARIDNNGFFDWPPYVTLHEILHAIGLSHPGDYNGAGFNYEDHAQFQQDTRQYSVMSYWDAAKTGADHFIGSVQHVAQTPLLYDILALQKLYGANMSTRTGDTVYGFHSNTGASPFNFVANPAPVIAIWDAGGRDTLDFSGWSGPSVIDLNEGAFSSGGGLTKNVAIAFGAVIENALGGSGKDLLIGNQAANILNGGAGADTMRGGGGDDLYIVAQAGDRAIESDADGGFDTVRSSVSFTLGPAIEKLVLTGTAANATGNGLDNLLVGNSSANILNGKAGADSMKGGAGNDLYIVDDPGDRVIETSSAHGIDTVRSSVDFALGANLERLTLVAGAVEGAGNGTANLILGNGAANLLRGGGGFDRLEGGARADTLQGGRGNDKLFGGAGKDVLTGGKGKDGFYFDAPLSAKYNVDTILDFAPLDDTIFLDRSVFTGIAQGRLASQAFRLGTEAADSNDRILYDQATGRIFYDPDGDGAAAAILFAQLEPGTRLTSADFVGYI